MMRTQNREGEGGVALGEDTDAGCRTGDFTFLCAFFLRSDRSHVSV